MNKEIIDHFGIHLKTMDGWDEFALQTGKENWDDYCKPGDLVDDGVYEHFLNIMPPHFIQKGYLQVGEPKGLSRDPATGRTKSTYATFSHSGIEGVWEYCGACFTEEFQCADMFHDYGDMKTFLKDTFRMRFGIHVNRPHIYCKDGFRMSVQANNCVSCSPRGDFPDDVYVACEVGFPSQKEELLMPYADDPTRPTKTIYEHVPVDIIEQVIKKHGGFFESRIPAI